MIEDLKFLGKKRRIIEVAKFLESKYKKNLNYEKIRYLYRQNNPLFGPKDCQKFVAYVSEQGAFVEYEQNTEDKSLTKLLFVTNVMYKNYKRYGNIVLIGATYKTNKYQIPLLVISRITEQGRNTIFALVLINDESAQTYQWALKVFLEGHKGRKPNLFVTDGDLALCRAVTDVGVHHFICQ